MPPPLHARAPPVPTSCTRVEHLYNCWTYTDTSLSPRLAVGGVRSVGLDKFVMTCIHHSSIIWNRSLSPKSSVFHPPIPWYPLFNSVEGTLAGFLPCICIPCFPKFGYPFGELSSQRTLPSQRIGKGSVLLTMSRGERQDYFPKQCLLEQQNWGNFKQGIGAEVILRWQSPGRGPHQQFSGFSWSGVWVLRGLSILRR